MGIFKSKNKGEPQGVEIDFRKNKIKYVLILGFWLKVVIKSKYKSAFYDIFHFDKKLNNPQQWFEAGLFLYDCLLFLLDGTDLDSYLSVPLSYSEKSTNIADLNYSYIQAGISTENPPTLNLYPLVNNAFKIEQGIFIEGLSAELGKRVYFEEERLDDGRYMRRIVVYT